MTLMLVAGPAIAQSLPGSTASVPAPTPAPMSQILPAPDFVTLAEQSDEFERREGRLALARSANPHVRRAGMMMVQVHAGGDGKIRMAAARQGLPPMPPPGLNVEQQQKYDRLKDASGRDFDRMYVHQQVVAHQKMLAAMTAFAQGGPPGPVRNAAMEIAPIVQQQLEMFQNIQSMM